MYFMNPVLSLRPQWKQLIVTSKYVYVTSSPNMIPHNKTHKLFFWLSIYYVQTLR